MKSKTRKYGTIGSIAGAVFILLPVFGIEIAPDKQETIISAIVIISSLVAAQFAESPVQEKIDEKKSQ